MNEVVNIVRAGLSVLYSTDSMGCDGHAPLGCFHSAELCSSSAENRVRVTAVLLKCQPVLILESASLLCYFIRVCCIYISFVYIFSSERVYLDLAVMKVECNLVM